jgi:hypothetical protein
MCQSIKTRHSVTSDQLARLGVYPYETIFSDPCACFYRDDAAPASVPSWNFHRIPDSSSSASVLRSRLLFSRLLLRTVRIRLLCSTVLEAPVLGTRPLVLPLTYARCLVEGESLAAPRRCKQRPSRPGPSNPKRQTPNAKRPYAHTPIRPYAHTPIRLSTSPAKSQYYQTKPIAPPRAPGQVKFMLTERERGRDATATISSPEDQI